MEGIDLGYRALAAAAIKVAVEDLDVAHRKIRIWDEKHRKGTLKDYVQKNTEKQNYTPITLTQEDQSAIKFFDPADKAHQLYLYFEMLDIEHVPRAVQEQIDYISANRDRLEAIIRGYRVQATRKKNDEKLAAENSGKNNACNAKNDGL